MNAYSVYNATVDTALVLTVQREKDGSNDKPADQILGHLCHVF